MKKKIKYLWEKYDLSTFFSLLASLLVACLHLFRIIVKYDKIIFSYCIFAFLVFIFKIIQLLIEKKSIKINPYLVASLSVLLLLIPMTACFTWTILIKEYVFDYFAYVYGAYGITKLIIALRSQRKYKNKYGRKNIVSFLNLIVAFYTIMMMEYRLIMFSTSGIMTKSSRAILLTTQGAILIFSIWVMIFFYKKRNKIFQISNG
ncbi:MAG: hypothetical protein ACI4U5_02820 [Bacilli bacterium]